MTIESRAKWFTLLSCSLSCFIAWLDFAIVNTALPAIEKDLSASLVQLQWVMNAFVFALTVLVVMWGRISDHVGRKKMNILGVSVFGLFSLLAGLANSAGWLILCRFLQGAASAAIIPTSLALISHAFPGTAEKGKAMGIWGAVTGLGMALGPSLGGILVSALSWRWIFYINVPFSILSVIVSILFTQESKQETAALKPDYKGVFLLTIGLGSLILALMHAPDFGWLSAKTLTLAAIAILVLSLFIYFENRSTSPTIPLSLFKCAPFTLSTIVMFGLVFAFTAALFLIPLYLIQFRGQEAYQAGFTLFPITAIIPTLSPFVGRWMHKVSSKKLMLFGLFFFLAGTFMQIWITRETSLIYLITSYLCIGTGWTVTRTPATTSAIASAPHHFAGTATGVLWTLQNTGGALSIAITLTLFRKLSESSFLAGYSASMWLLTATTLALILILFFYLRPRKPD